MNMDQFRRFTSIGGTTTTTIMNLDLLFAQALENIWAISLLVGLLVLGIVLTLVRTATSFGKVKSSQPAILITGPAYSGKTSLYTLWTSGSTRETVTSQVPNVYSSFKIPFDSPVDAVRITLVDLPGHNKLVHHLEEALGKFSNVRGIIFVIDAASGPEGIRTAAEALFKLLLRTEQRMGGIDIMIACNKADVFNMVPAMRMKLALENEIQEIRSTKAKSLGTVAKAGSLEDDNEDDGSWLGGDTFRFVDLDGEISIADGSAVTDNVENWKRWLEEVAVN